MMKTARKFHTGKKDCSCISCLYKSASDQSSLGRFNLQSCRLYHGEHIPMRERKLLEKLVRTRAVYDDIRAKLISDSTISLIKKDNSKPKKKLISKELDDNDKNSGLLLELIDHIDKGASLGLSEHCSCCICSSKEGVEDHRRTKRHRSHFGSRRQVDQKERLDLHHKRKGVRFKAKHIRSDPCTCTFKFSELFKNNKGDVLKKNIPAEPIDLQQITNEERQSTQKKVREFARRSYENIKQSNKQIRQKVLEGIEKVKESKTNIQERLQADVQASAVKLKQTTNKLKSKNKTAPPKRESVAKLQLNDLLGICMCPADQIFKIPSKESLLDVYKQKSKEKIIQAKNKLKSAMKSTMERKPKTTTIKTKTSGTYFPTEKDIALQVKKDSITKFQEELRRKQIMKDWECDPECIDDTCVPEECYIKLKHKRKNMKHRGLEHQIRKQEKKSGVVLSQKNEKIQSKALTVQNKTATPTPKPTVEKKDVKVISKQKIVSPKKKSSLLQGVRVKSSFSFDIQFYKQQPNMRLEESVIPKPTPSGINYKTTKNPCRKPCGKHRNSQVVSRHSSRDTQTDKRSLKRCFCTQKIKSNKPKCKNIKKHKTTTAEKSITTFEPVTPCKHVDCSVEMYEQLVCPTLMSNKCSNAHTNTCNKFKKKRHIKQRCLLPYECEPGICTPGNCDPYECIKLINSREAKFRECSANCVSLSRKTKSTCTLTSKSNKASKAKMAQSLYTYCNTQKRDEGKPKMERKNVHNAYGRQSFGSTISFNIEFYKNKPPQHYPQPCPPTCDLKSFVVKPKCKEICKPKLKEVCKPKLKERGFQGDVACIHKNIPTQMCKKKRDAAISASLKRCFCTLKLQRKSHCKLKRKKIVSTGTKTIEERIIKIVTCTKGTKTKQKHMKCLEPYECEPFTCIPGECNPYECLERINRRNLKDVGVCSAFNCSKINKGSSISEKSSKAVKTQSKPQCRQQKVLTNVKRPKRQTQTFKEKVCYTSCAPSQQSVRIGSMFSFNIEFYKNKPAMRELKTNYEMRPTVKLDTRPITKCKGVKICKLNVANLETQVEELKKHCKASTAKPLLKRCFCTLNLRKNKNNARTTPFKSTVMQSQVYTVNTAMVKHNRLSIFKANCSKSICLSQSANINMNSSLKGQLSDSVIKSLYNECRRLNSNKHLQCKSCYPLITSKLEKIKSNFNTALKLISQSYLSDNLRLSGMGNPQLIKGANNVNQYSSHVNQEKKGIVYTSKICNGEKKHLSGLTQYLKGYFCTMNLQVVRNKYTAKQKAVYSDVGNQSRTRPRKLKPYECEPGVCVPGECDPYECLKLISKRDSNSKKTATENTVTSSSSYTNRSPKHKSYKVQSKSQKTTKLPVSRVYQDQHKLGEKKAVRVGSTFSFDIEFFKNAASPQIVKNKIRTSKLSSVTKPPRPKRTSSYSKTTGMNKQNLRDQHSQSAFSKTLQKASATLPRMKRCFCTLKLQKKGKLQKEQKQPSEALQTEAIIPQLTTIDRGQKTPKFKPLKIAPLQPYECQPGICIPGQCNPHECWEIMKKLNYNQTADSSTDAIAEDSKSSASMTASELKHKTRTVSVKPKVISKSNLSEGRQKRRVQPTNVMNSTKQAVRIGSNFSFNIEFHKSKNSLDYPTEYVPKKPPRSFQHNISDLRKRNIKIKQRSSETSTAKRNQHSQFKTTAQAASTMTTSFMKRCFCVLKLRKNKKTKIVDTNVVKTVTKPVNMDKKTNTKRYKERVLQLEPYECEPGICIPGECDPYACEKIIKRRNLRSQSSSTAYKSTRSTSSTSPSTAKRNINTQFRPNKTTREAKKQVYTKTKVPDSKRQAVKIGSSFSFDIEFYKDKTSKLKDYEIPRSIKKDMLSSKVKSKKQKNSGSKTPPVSFKSQTSEIKVNKKDFAAGINNVIKRCFCTLQLYNQRSRKESKPKEKKKKPIENQVHSKGVMTTEKNKINLDSLEPYECEPNICVPYECDPYECEKLIKLRQRKQHQREVGMSTQHSSKQSAASSTVPFKKTKKKTQSISLKNKEIIPKVKSFKRIQDAQSKQCVKIGSRFSFDIEFYKNKNGVQFDQKPQYREPKLQVQKMNKVSRKPTTKTQGLQSQKLVNTSPSQMNNEFMKTVSTMARATPPLKRCFCTFHLKKPKKEPVSIPKPIMSDVSTITTLRDPKVQPVTKLLPYECEPNTCIPGECNPLECLERIKKRQKNYGTSTNHLQKNEFGSSMLQNKTKNRRSQFKSLGHVKQRQHKQLVTNNATKQAVRIGSNFSFNIDFYKQRGFAHFDGKVSDEHKYKKVSKPLKAKSKNKQVNKKLDYNTQQNRGSQSLSIQQYSKSSAIEPFLKRCFCTLKLQKKPATTKTALKTTTNEVQKVIKPTVVSRDRGTLTKKYKNKIELGPYECEPNTCIPGECDPYECLKRIEARNLKNISTQILKPLAQKSVGMNLANTDSKNIQSNLVSNLPKKSKVNQSNIVEIPRFGNLFNKQAVKIGSNFSFNIEFYKEILPPTAETYPKVDKVQRYVEPRPKKPKKYTDSANTSTLAKYHNKGIQGYGVKTDNKALEVGNALKRCFCTLKLQKELNSKQSRPKIQKPQYPQVIEVRRVSVKQNKQTLTEVKSIGTKTEAKYIDASCNPLTCRDYKLLNPEEMKVIHPYTPSKFNKTPSKTIQNQELHNMTNTKPRKTKITNRGKRLTKKKSKKSIQPNQLFGNDFNPANPSLSNFQKFMCRCAQLFSHKTEPQNLINSTVQQLNDQNKKSNKTVNLQNSPYQIMNSPYQAGDIVQHPTMSLKMIKKHQMHNAVGSIPHNKERIVKESRHQKDNEKTKHIQENVLNEIEDFFCTHCKNIKMNKRHSQPLKVHFLDTPTITNKDVGKKIYAKDGLALMNKSVDQIDKHRMSIQKNKIKTDTQSRKLAKYCKYCTTCGKKLNNEEIQKAAGDQKSLKGTSKENTSNADPQLMLSKGIKSTFRKRTPNADPLLTHSKSLKSTFKKKKPNADPLLTHSKSLKSTFKKKKPNADPQLTHSKSLKSTFKGKTPNADPQLIHSKSLKSTFNEKTPNADPQLIHSKSLKSTFKGKTPNADPQLIHSKSLKSTFKEKTPIADPQLMHSKSLKSTFKGKTPNADPQLIHSKSLKSTFKEKTPNANPQLVHSKGLKSKFKQKTPNADPQLMHSKSLKNTFKQKTPNAYRQLLDSKTVLIKNLFRYKQSVDNICSAEGPRPPLFEMHLDSDDYGILNKDEVIAKVKRLSKKSMKDKKKDKHLDKTHGKSCRCCICLGKRNKTGARFNVTPKGSKFRGNFGKRFGGTLSYLPTGKPCICGSEVCAAELTHMVKESRIPMHRRKTCDCGSPICDIETETMNSILDAKEDLSCICAIERAKELKKLHAKNHELKMKNRAKRLKKYNEEDKARNKESRKKNKILEKKINTNASDMVLAVESLIDIGKLGIKAGADILRTVARTAIDPKQAYNNLKAMKENPDIVLSLFKTGEGQGEITSTCRRIRLRCLSMQGIKNIKNTLERYAVTNYLLYMFHKDPAKRIVKRRREREQTDFDCSLYMGSLRKKPFLSVYNKYPWFYPHFLSLVNVWKQFMEIALFLVAVLVWSPCIFCMEACRAFMCCFLCTG